jgi:hypothetical protein
MLVSATGVLVTPPVIAGFSVCWTAAPLSTITFDVRVAMGLRVATAKVAVDVITAGVLVPAPVVDVGGRLVTCTFVGLGGAGFVGVAAGGFV